MEHKRIKAFYVSLRYSKIKKRNGVLMKDVLYSIYYAQWRGEYEL